MHTASISTRLALEIPYDGQTKQSINHDDSYWPRIDRLPMPLAEPVLAPPHLAVADIPLNTPLDWHLFRGGDVTEATPTAHHDVHTGVKTVCFTCDPAVAVAYGAMNNIYGGPCNFRLFQMTAQDGVRFGDIAGPCPSGPGLHIALPEPGSPARTHKLAYYDRRLLQRAESAGWDGVATWDCTKQSNRHHLTIHVFDRGVPKITPVSMGTYRLRADIEVYQPERATPVIGRLLDRWLPMGERERFVVQGVVDLQTPAAYRGASSLLESHRLDPAYQAESISRTPWGEDPEDLRTLAPGITEASGGGRVGVFIAPSVLERLTPRARTELPSAGTDGVWLESPSAILRAAAVLPRILPDAWSRRHTQGG